MARRQKFGVAVALAVVLGAAVPALSAGATPSGTAIASASPNTPNDSKLSDMLLEFAKNSYEAYTTQLKALAKELDQIRASLTGVYQSQQLKVTELDRLRSELVKEKGNEARAAIEQKIRGIEAELRVLDQRATDLQNRSDKLSDEIKVKNLNLQQLFDIMTQVQQSLDKILIKQAQRIGR